MTWLILKTDHAKEFAVAEALTALGHECWVPTYVCEVRERQTVGPGITLRVRKAKERPLLPSLLLANTANPIHDTLPPLTLDHLQGAWRNGVGGFMFVPPKQVEAFRARVEEVNAREHARIRNKDKKRPKKKFKLDPNMADLLKEMIFGAQQGEAA